MDARSGGRPIWGAGSSDSINPPERRLADRYGTFGVHGPFFDCRDEPTVRYRAGKGAYESVRESVSLVRSVRVPAGDLDGGLVLSLYGKVLRRGPGWWIHQPGTNVSEESLAIAAQLRAVETADPSPGIR